MLVPLAGEVNGAWSDFHDGRVPAMRRAGIVAVAVMLVCAVSASAAAPEKVYYEKPFGGMAYKPKRIEFSDLTLNKIRWRDWNSRRSIGRGRARINTCDPSCGAGNIVRGRAKLRVFQRHRAEDGRLVYGCLKGTTRAGGETRRVQWPPGCGS
jgi:hypothetical protein